MKNDDVTALFLFKKKKLNREKKESLMISDSQNFSKNKKNYKFEFPARVDGWRVIRKIRKIKEIRKKLSNFACVCGLKIKSKMIKKGFLIDDSYLICIQTDAD